MTDSTPATPPAPPAQDDSIGLDRAFVLQMASWPLLAAGLVLVGLLAAWAYGAAALPRVEHFGPPNPAGLIVLMAGMVACAWVDGTKFKVPNSFTMPLVLSGWALGALASAGLAPADAFGGNFVASLVGTLAGMFTLVLLLAVRGMGEGDVKMMMAYGAWVGALVPLEETVRVVGWSFAVGAITGGVIAVFQMMYYRDFGRNWSNTVEIYRDLHVLVNAGAEAAAKRAEARHATRIRLPYGVPLCIGMFLYLGYRYYA